MGVTVPPIREYRRQIEAALAHADHSHTFEDIEAGVESGAFQYWPGVRSVIVTTIEHFPNFNSIDFLLAGGDLAEVEMMYPHVEEWAKAQGCKRATMTGRKGWERTFLAREGWKAKSVVFGKML